MSIENLKGGAGTHLSERQITEQEQRDNAEMAGKKSQLEALQKQQPPAKQAELVDYLMKRLRAAEESIKVCENVIESERALRKATSKQMKTEIQDLEVVVHKEKKSLSDKVSAELDHTLKQAVREKVQTKQDLEAILDGKDKLQKEYDNLREMYQDMREGAKQSEKFNEDSQKLITALENENQQMKDEKLALSKANIEKTEKMD